MYIVLTWRCIFVKEQFDVIELDLIDLDLDTIVCTSGNDDEVDCTTQACPTD